jgi:uncharacterized membrane-anchored protein
MSTLKNNLRYIIIVFGVVLVWRGIWGLTDHYLFPHNPLLSSITSIIFGVVLLFLIDFKKKDISELN